jgi:peptide chain release factor 2
VDIDNSILATNLLSEIKFSTSRSSGPGGQNVNKVNTKVSLRWNVVESAILLPDQKELLLKKWATRLTVDGALLIVSQEKRSQLQNKEKALQLLKSQLFEAELARRHAARDEIEAGKKKIEWGSQIRNYVMQPYKLVKDVRTGEETSDVEKVMNGEIDNFLKAFLMGQGKGVQHSDNDDL